MDAQLAFVRHELIAGMEPPRPAVGAPTWLRQRLFGSVFNTVLTVASIVLLVALVWPATRFLLINAVWTGSGREVCTPADAGPSVGACWPIIAAKLRQFMYGFYPADEQWRANLTYAIGAILLAP